MHYLTILLAGYLALVMVFYVFQRAIIYHPSDLKTISAAYQAGAHYVQFNTVDNLQLTAIYQPAKDNNPTLIVLMGNAGYLGQLSPTLANLAMKGYGILQVGYRGYSGNPGKPTEKGLYQDGRGAIKFLQQHGITHEKIILFGESLGAAVAVQLATEYPIKAVILQSPFNTLSAVANYHYPYIPNKWFLVDKFESAKKISSMTAPLLIVHGDQDFIVPLKYGIQLYDAATGIKDMKIIEDSGHNDLDDYSQDIIQFLSKQ